MANKPGKSRFHNMKSAAENLVKTLLLAAIKLQPVYKSIDRKTKAINF
jgi:hypothetical protein